MTVAQLREEMSALEFMEWTRFHAIRNQQQELAAKG